MKKSLMVSGMQFGAEFLTNLYKEVVKRGGTEEGIFESLKTGSDLIPKFAEMIIEATGVKKLILKSLKFIATVAVNTSSSSKGFFSNGPVKLYFGSNFRSWVLEAMQVAIPAFQGTLLKTQLTKYMNDSEILDELGHPKSFTVSEFAAIIRDSLLEQPNGENGMLLNNGYANIFHVLLEDGRVVVVDVGWDSDDRGWFLDAYDLDVGRWGDGRCVFSRS